MTNNYNLSEVQNQDDLRFQKYLEKGGTGFKLSHFQTILLPKKDHKKQSSFSRTNMYKILHQCNGRCNIYTQTQAYTQKLKEFFDNPLFLPPCPENVWRQAPLSAFHIQIQTVQSTDPAQLRPNVLSDATVMEHNSQSNFK